MAENIFLSAVKNITEKNLPIHELIATAESLMQAGRLDLAVQVYRLWINFNPDSHLLYVIRFNLAVTLTTLNDQAAAKDELERALELNPDFFPALINLGSLLERLGDAGQGVVQWQKVVQKLAPVNGAAIRFKTAAMRQIGRVLGEHHQTASAEETLRQSLDILPDQPDVSSHFISYRLSQCKWPVVAPWEGVDRKALMTGIGPLPLVTYADDPVLQLAMACSYNKRTVGYPPIDLQQARGAGAEPGRERLRIGYVSSDLREHAVGFLTAELFELHDRNAVEVFAYYCGVPSSDPLNARFKAAAEHWTDISGMDEMTAARRIADDAIDILVDLNGYTRDGWLKLFSMRPAPVIVNWLGYPGTMGSPYHHYIIADDWIIPESHEIYFSEKVVRLPCYQPNDRKRLVAPVRPTRQEAGLPDDAFVFCCFNGMHKSNRFTFERWMTILKRVPNSVLWLLKMSEETDARLKMLAEQAGVSPDRLIFSTKLANPYHLARYPLADLFLDTLPYGAHTTASDALWMGVPVLTLSGRSFASRVCGSLVRSANIPELICRTSEEYVERAVSLATNPAGLQQYKDRLAAGRDTCVLFDTQGLVHHLEQLYRQMWENFRNGRQPAPDLANLDIYQEVGIEEDLEAVDMASIPDYLERYKAKLERRHRLWTIPADHRLWTADDVARVERAMRMAEVTSPAL